MADIRPISDLRNKFTEISRTVHESGEPVILTKNGYGNMVVLSYDLYEQMRYETGIAQSLRDAERQAEETDERFSHAQVMASMKSIVEQGRKNHGL
ncbi:MAG: type II toxin-antitoxin system Phd/YefM family antitoxin [Clostridiales bacterium]|jgi:prevent-host-death family protein|nr:type II toxin-antitoxin system Phd/YefM family antitoxin [Clostridiales bacterium]